MDRSKVLKLAQEAKISIRGHYDETGSTPQELDRFAALIEREVRGDVEPVAWMYEWDGKKHLTFTDQRPIEQSHPHFNKSAPLYTHPAPAVTCYHAWIRTGAMGDEEKRCIKCGEWGKR